MEEFDDQLRLANEMSDGDSNALLLLLLVWGKFCCCGCGCCLVTGGPGPLGGAVAPPQVFPLEKVALDDEVVDGKFRSKDTLGTIPEFMMSLKMGRESN